MYRAFTIPPRSSEDALPLVPRNRLLQLTRSPFAAKTTWIAAPVGYGKTTFAFQWAATHDAPVQYIAAREVPDGLRAALQPGDDLGTRIAELLSIARRASDAPEEIAEIVHSMRTMGNYPHAAIIADDLDLLSPATEQALIDAVSQEVPIQSPMKLMLISRRLMSEAYMIGNFWGSARIISQDALAFDDAELDEAMRRGLLPAITVDDMPTFREATRGWFGGMQLAQHGVTSAPFVMPFDADIDYTIMNEIVLPLSPAMRQIAYVWASIPAMTPSLWNRMTRGLSEPSPTFGTFRNAIPSVQIGRTSSGEIAATPVPLVRDSLRRLAIDDVTQLERRRELLITAITWLVEDDDIDAARQIAASEDFWPPFLQVILPRVRAAASREDAHEVIALTRDIPDDALLAEPDLLYARINAVFDLGDWPETMRLEHLALPQWERSPDPRIRGRALLLRAWVHHAMGNADQTIPLATASYDTLPADDHPDRMRPAATLELVHAYQGQRADADRWASIASSELAYLPVTSHWWHRNTGHMRFDRLALQGNLPEVRDLLETTVRELALGSPSDQFRYLLLMAGIDRERGAFASAEALVEQASAYAQTSQDQVLLQIMQASLPKAQGNPGRADDLLRQRESGQRDRLDQDYRRTMLLAAIALDQHDIVRAETIVMNTAAPVDSWPRSFLDVHPIEIAASIQWLKGEPLTAIDQLDHAMHEARRRRHTSVLIRFHALLAAMHESVGHEDVAERAATRAATLGQTGGFQTSYRVLGFDVRHERARIADVVRSIRARATRLELAEPRALSLREIEILQLVARGLPNRLIGEALFISPSTVRNHLSSAFDKLGARTRQSAVTTARRLGYLDDP